MTYKLIDKQGMGTMQDRTFATLAEAREALASYHSVDYTGEQDINTLTLDELLDYGEWKIAKLCHICGTFTCSWANENKE